MWLEDSGLSGAGHSTCPAVDSLETPGIWGQAQVDGAHIGEATQTLRAWNPPFPAPVICWRTSRCAGGLGIWDALSELVLAGSAESFLRGWVAGSWLAGLKTEGKSF